MKIKSERTAFILGLLAPFSIIIVMIVIGTIMALLFSSSTERNTNIVSQPQIKPYQGEAAQYHKQQLAIETVNFVSYSLQMDVTKALTAQHKIIDNKEALIEHYNYTEKQVNDLIENTLLFYYNSLPPKAQQMYLILADVLEETM